MARPEHSGPSAEVLAMDSLKEEVRQLNDTMRTVSESLQKIAQVLETGVSRQGGSR